MHIFGVKIPCIDWRNPKPHYIFLPLQYSLKYRLLHQERLNYIWYKNLHQITAILLAESRIEKLC